MKTENLNAKNEKPYKACPYCLTEITIETAPVVIRAEPVYVNEHDQIRIDSATDASNEKGRPYQSKQPACPHHLGYLSDRSNKEKIPEQCMVCENIVKCMLKNVTG
ncbi:MAG: hypothetical protein QHH24_00365 [Candidatus Bathyarchaeota archaeon]|nr:hypothetical protein [Candidatus Bathyarchaeota archaeon]